jgi:hypothetical protein
MKTLIIIIGLLVLLLGCEKSVKTCNFIDPLKDLPWLQELKTSFTNCSCEMSIIQATYNKQTVFYSAMTDPICNGIYPIVLRDCTGDIVKSYESINQVKDNDITNIKTLFMCKIE